MKLTVNYQLENFASSFPHSTHSEKDIFNWCDITYGNTSETATKTVQAVQYLYMYKSHSQ